MNHSILIESTLTVISQAEERFKILCGQLKKQLFHSISRKCTSKYLSVSFPWSNVQHTETLFLSSFGSLTSLCFIVHSEKKQRLKN